MAKTVRAKSPLRLGLAGGGTDVSPYSEKFGGCVLNATIDMYAHCTIAELNNGTNEFVAADLNQQFSAKAKPYYDLSGELLLHKAIYNRIVRDYNNNQPLSLRITTYADVLPGSGLGSSSTMVVSILNAFQEYLKLPLGEYDLAHLAYDIERLDCRMAGGKQDQYAATFGGFNFIEFCDDDKVIVNPLRIKDTIINELQARLLLYFTGVSRDSAKIIEEQIQQVNQIDSKALSSMHETKRLAFAMKEKLLKADINGMMELFQQAWETKKQLAHAISNPFIDALSDKAFQAGALALKISGAGGGGFMMIFAEPTQRIAVMQSLASLGGEFYRFQFTHHGTTAWTV
jgi:D-glycero-alpha-D-manno-heptose-7-phosphate kinase